MPAALIDNVTVDDFSDFMGRADDTFVNSIAPAVLAMSREMCSSYTRGVGFADSTMIPASLRWVVMSRAARLVLNGAQLLSEQRDSVRLDYGSAGQGFTLTEVMALQDYRVIAA